MLLGVIADDFTGAGDVANALALGGMRTRLFVGADAVENRGKDGCEAGVVALKTRSVGVAEAVAAALAALDRLRAAGCRQFLFKYCSTFDSTPAGNIGPVAEALAAALDARGVIVCPAFPATGRTVFHGHLFVGNRLLSESGMERHPLTPMTDPDIRRWLTRQTREAPGYVGHATVRAGAAAIAAALAATSATLVVVDAICDADLDAIGAAAAGAALVTGGSGVAQGLPANFCAAGLLGGARPMFAANRGPALVLAGSCSTATRAQVADYAAAHPALAIDVDRLLDGAPVLDEARAFIDTHADAAPLVHSSTAPGAVAATQARHGSERAAAAVEGLFGELVRHAVDRGCRRIVVAGGETSGAVVTALGLDALDLGGEIDPGVPALSTATGTPLALALKSGNFGSTDFMAKAVRVLGSGNG